MRRKTGLLQGDEPNSEPNKKTYENFGAAHPNETILLFVGHLGGRSSGGLRFSPHTTSARFRAEPGFKGSATGGEIRRCAMGRGGSIAGARSDASSAGGCLSQYYSLLINRSARR